MNTKVHISWYNQRFVIFSSVFFSSKIQFYRASIIKYLINYITEAKQGIQYMLL